MANHAPIEAAEIQITRIFISSGHAYWTKGDEEPFGHAIQELTEVECMAGMGLRGDRHSVGKATRKGQVTFMSESAIEAIRNEFQLPHLPSSVFRRNIIVRGVELSALLNKRFEIQGVWFEGAQECKPCKWMDEVVAPGAKKFMQQGFRGGLRAKILCDGVLTIGPEFNGANCLVARFRTQRVEEEQRKRREIKHEDTEAGSILRFLAKHRQRFELVLYDFLSGSIF